MPDAETRIEQGSWLNWPDFGAKGVAAEAPALLAGGKLWTYAELKEAISRVAVRLLAGGVAQGDRIGVLARGSCRIIAQLAVLRAGAVVVPLDPLKSDRELASTVAQMRVSVVLRGKGTKRLAKDLARDKIAVIAVADKAEYPAPAPGFPVLNGLDPAVVLPTAGHDQAPGPVTLSHGDIHEVVAALGRVAPMGPGDVVLPDPAALWFDALLQVCAALLAGATLAVHDGKADDPRVLRRIIRRHRVAIAFSNPEMFRQVVKRSPEALKNLRLIVIRGNLPAAAARSLVSDGGQGPAIVTAPNPIAEKAAVGGPVSGTIPVPVSSERRRKDNAPALDARAVRAVIAQVWSEVLGCPPPGDDDTFFGLGGSSLHLVSVRARLETLLGHRIDTTTMFEVPRLRDLADRIAVDLSQADATDLATEAVSQPVPDAVPGFIAAPDPQPLEQVAKGAVAIIGLSGRFPGVNGIEGFWQAICDGRNLISRFDPSELEDAFTDEERASPDYVPVRPVLDDADMFDARFFGVLPREAEVMDPQHRLFLEICYEALEAAGLDPFAVPGLVGVFAGQTANTYIINNVLGDRRRAEDFTSNFQVGNYAIQTGNWVDSLATRVSFKLDLKGPALTLQTACSTSLMAIAEAIDSLHAGRCDMALAGGISLSFPQRRGYRAIEGGMVSPEGVCRPFDEAASGTVFGHGAGVVLLKPLARALADGDPVIAVIRGAGVNNDGADKMSFTAPSIAGQAEAIRLAHQTSGVDPATISYVECHGTATPLGDPIELAGLAKAFGEGCARASVAIGSVKGNLGHLDAAAGVVSVIKTALMLQHSVIPPVANFRNPNSRFDFANSPFFVPDGLGPWMRNLGPRRAGVSSFGVGGTNVHLVMEEAPPRAPAAQAPGPFILPLSARTPEALAAMRSRLADHLEAAAPNLADVAMTLQEGRHKFPLRSAVACEDLAQAVASLRKPPTALRPAPVDAPPVVFLFPGQGSQYPGMGSGLYAAEPVFRDWIDRGAEILRPLLGLDINDLLCFADTSDEAAARALRETHLTQPALFLIQVATASLWQARGVRPAAMIGHSVGELAAATLAGVMDFETGLRIIATRGRLMQDQPGGAMLSVRASVDEVTPHLDDSVDIAARNAPKLNVLSGSFEAVAALARRLEGAGIPHSLLQTSHAFHSRMMDPVCAALARAIGDIDLKAPEIPIVSTVTGKWITPNEACDPAYWAGQARATVDFATAIKTVVEGQSPVLLEVGAGSVLSTFAGQTLPRDGHGGIISSLPDHTRPLSDTVAMARSAGQLWAAGVGIDWAGWRTGPARRVALPTYPFQRQRHWIDPPPPLRRHPSASLVSLRPEPVPPDPKASTAAETAAMQTGATMNQFSPLASNAEATDRRPRLVAEVTALLSDLSGETITAGDADASFLELGFDSLFLGQVTQRLGKDYGTSITFRQLLSDYPTTAALASYLDEFLPPEPAAVAPPAPDAATLVVSAAVTAHPPSSVTMAAPSVSCQDPPSAIPAGPCAAVATPVNPASLPAGTEGVMHQQMMVMQTLFSEQLRVLGRAGHVPSGSAVQPAPPMTGRTAPAPQAPATQAPAPQAPAPQAPTPPANASPPAAAPALIRPETEEPVRYSIGRGVAAGAASLTDEQLRFARDLAARYGRKYPGSKAYAGQHRAVLADPRSAAGFRQEWKEMVFPIVAARSKGARIWDVDGNEFIDIVNGFGQTAFGHAPDFVDEALRCQMDKGFAIGPQSDLAGPVAEKFARTTGHERVTFCNTGSEAVMAAMRVARAVTGRDLVVVFANDYHGQFDEVLIKGRSRGGPPSALPIAPGIPRSGLSNMIVLPYGGQESVDWIRANGDGIAAIIVEPVQSRHPEHRPVDFVRELRVLADAAGAALVFDEVVTGFRVHARGMQGIWGIRADLATYGKVVGGGMPIGVLAGDARFMDALDGGAWTYGDDSRPDTPPTFFAGTFVRHPLVLAAVDATLDHMAEQGEDLWTRVAARTGALVEEFDRMFKSRGLPPLIQGYSSWYAFNLMQHAPSAALAYPLMRLAGVHVQEGYCGFMTTAHSEDDFRRIAAVMAETVDTLQGVGILAPEHGSEEPGATSRPEEPTPPTPDTTQARQTEVLAPASAIPLTPEQQEIWMTAQNGDLASTGFNEGTIVHFKGPLDHALLQRALEQVVARHDALRLVFARNGETFDVAPPQALDLPLIDLRGAQNKDEAFRAILDEEARVPFDLVQGQVFRAVLVQRDEKDHAVVLNAHHIVCDGWSWNVALQDLAVLYTALAEGRTPDLPPAPSFAAYAAERSARPASNGVDGYWRTEFATVAPLPELPTDRPRGPRRSYEAATLTTRVDSATAATIRKAGARLGCTLFATLFAGLHLVLARLSGSSDHVIGVPTAGQTLLPNQSMVGHCVNFLPIRVAISPDATVAAHFAAVRDKILAAFDHQDTTYGALVQSLALERSLNRLPLTEVQFNLEKMAEGMSIPGLEIAVEPNAKAAANFDLFFNVIESDDGLRFDVDFSTALYDEGTILRWISHLQALLTGLAENADRPVTQAPIMSAVQALELERRHNDTDTNLPRAPLHELLRRTAETVPDAQAVAAPDGTLSYAELDGLTDALAARIQSVLPQPGCRVAVALDRSRDMIVSLAAVLKAGHTYVPLDPRQPAARLRLILETAQASAIISASDGLPDFAQGLSLAHMRPQATGTARPIFHAIDPESAAYVIFTSGSTGTPKGVAVSHRAAVNLLLSMAREPGFGPADTMLAVTTVSFDIAVLELFLPLLVGGRVVIAAHEDVLDGFRLVERIGKGDITVVQATPTLWSMLLEAGLVPRAGLRMLAGGEPLPLDLARRLTADGGELWNMYGPTETTIWSAAHRIGADATRITIGHPIANTQLHVLDPLDQLVPPGVAGELNIGGLGLANGYFGRDDLTARAFRDVALPGGVRTLYRTGDLARRLADGTIEVLGRSDSQIKLRGFRIELGEIEMALRQAEGVDKAAVALCDDPSGQKQLVGYVVPLPGNDPAPRDLMQELRSRLPDYMVPTAWVTLSALPQTLNGKLDRKALPAPASVADVTPLRAKVAPASELETRLADIWKAVLGLEDIGTTDTLFALGADSLKVFRIASRMLDAGLDLEARHLLQYPTIRELAAYAASPREADRTTVRPSLRDFRHGARRQSASVGPGGATERSGLGGTTV